MPTRREALLALVFFVLVAVLFAPDAATGSGVFWHHDFRHHHYPWRVWGAGQWAHGVVPWWSSGAANGFPLLAEGEGGFLYPPTMLLFVLLPPGLAMDWTVLGHHAWAALGMWAFLRSPGREPGRVVPGVSSVAALLGGVAWGWSGFLVSHTMYLGMQNALAWMGWALWGARTGRPAWVALSIAMMGLAGHPQAAAFGGLLLGLHALATLRGRALFQWVGAAVTGAIVASPQLLASVKLSGSSMREGGVADLFANIGRLPPQELLNGVLPELFGFDRPADVQQIYYHRGDSYWGSGENYWEMCFYLGIPVVVLALLAARRHKAWVALAGVALLLMLGGPLWSLVRLLPGFEFFRFPARFAIWVTLAVAVLAAHGYDHLRTLPHPGRVGRRLVLLAWVGGIGIVGAGLLLRAGEEPVRAALTHHYEARAELPPPPDDLPPLQRAALPGADVTPPDAIPAKVEQVWYELWKSTSLLSHRVFLPIGLLLLAAAFARRPRLLLPLVVLDLWLFGHDFHPRVPVAMTEARPSWLNDEMTQPGAGRVTVLDRRVDPALDTELGTASLGLLWGTSDVLIPSPLLMLRNDAMLALTGLDVGDRGPQKKDRFVAHRALANRMGVRWIASVHTLSDLPDMTLTGWREVNVVEDRRALPRVRVVRCVQAATDADDAFVKVQAADPTTTVVLEGGVDGCVGTSDGVSGATFTRYTDQEVEVAATGPGTLLLADSWFDGWSATLDGADVPILRADVLYRGVTLPEGEHTVVFRYDPGIPGRLLPAAAFALFVLLLTATAQALVDPYSAARTR